MSTFLVANYDANERVVKLWSKKHGELKRSEVIDVDVHNITLSVKASLKDIQVTINGNLALVHTISDDEPLSGQFGLNIFSASVKFKSLSILKENYEYSSGNLEVPLSIDQFITAIYNVTLGNIRLEPGFYYQNNSTLYIKADYFDLLPSNGRYQFKVIGDAYSFTVNVDVNMSQSSLMVNDMVVDSGSNVSVYVGNNEIASVSVNGTVLTAEQYSVKDYTLHISAECFKDGDNEVILNDSVTFTVTINNLNDAIVHKVTTTDYTPMIVAISVGSCAVIIAALVVVLILVKKKGAK